MVDCGLVATPKFGRAAYVNGSQVFGTLVRYACDDGYMLAQGQMQRRCGEQGKWEGRQPSCQREFAGTTVYQIIRQLQPSTARRPSPR